MTATVISYSESEDLAGEVAAAAAELSGPMRAEPLALELDEVSPGLTCSGRALVAKGEKALEGDADLAAAAIVEAARAKNFRALLVGETRFGTVVAAKVAARLGVGSLGKGKRLRIEGERLVLERDVFGGKFVATVAGKTPCVATVQAGAYSPALTPPSQVQTMKVSAGEQKVVVVETKTSQRGEKGVKTASIVVSAGRGFEKKEDLALARDLAAVLGAALGCSRPLSSDLGWLGEEAHIGLTGASIHPKLYLAVGISGQLQHVAGIKDSKVIVAINKDSQAPIFQFADYGIVGDLYQVLPELTKVLKQG